jgi:hypothetical protein
MKISQKIEVGQIDHTYLSSWKSDNELELHKGDDVVVFTMTEEVMTQLHKKLGDKLTDIAEKRLEEAQEIAQVQEESSEDE